MISPEELARHISSVMNTLKRGAVVPFLGAGANLSGGPGGDWQLGGSRLPSGRELARYLADEFLPPTPNPLHLERVALDIAIDPGEAVLYDVLREVFDADYPPTHLHHLLARMPAVLRDKGWRALDVIVTTNYDDSLERAFLDQGVECHVLSYIARGRDSGRFAHFPPGGGDAVVIDDPGSYEMPEDEDGRLPPTVVKLHGAVDRFAGEHDSFVITEDHYIEYLAMGDIVPQLPAAIRARLARSHFLFLGYSLADWNVRAVLHRLWRAQNGERKSWSIQLGVDPLQVKAWDQRRVEVIEIDIGDYVAELEAALEALPAHAGRGSG